MDVPPIDASWVEVVEDTFDLDVEVSKLSLQKDDLLLVRVPPECIGNHFHSLVSALQKTAAQYKDLGVKVLVLTKGIDLDKIDVDEMKRAGWAKLEDKSKKETQEIKRVDGNTV
jgi:hypothetical protein